MQLIRIILLALLVNQSYGQVKDSRLQGVDAEIESLLKRYNAAGLAVSVVENDSLVYAKGFGYRDVDNNLPVDENTVFPIGSATKAFTGALLGQLAQENKLSLEDKPTRYVPGLVFYSDRMNTLITIADLLCHKSGIGNVDGTLVFFPAKNRLEIMNRLQYIKPNGEVKNSWLYSNMGYTIAGVLAEQITQKSWEENIKERLFIPLKMNASFTSLNEMRETGNFSYGYGKVGEKFKKVLFEEYGYGAYAPAGAIKSNVKDVANWLSTWLNEGEFDKKQVLPKPYAKEATRIQNIRPQEGADANVYLFGDGYGWRVESSKGHYKVHHGGNTSGFSAQLVTYPYDKLGIAVLTNQESSLLPYLIADIIANRMLKLPRTPWEQYPVVVRDVAVVDQTVRPLNPQKKISHQLSAYCGTYSNKGYGAFEIVTKDNNLYLKLPTYQFRLEHQHYDVFKMKAVKEIPQTFDPESFSLRFLPNDQGDISSVQINWQDDPVEFLKK